MAKLNTADLMLMTRPVKPQTAEEREAKIAQAEEKRAKRNAKRLANMRG